MLDIHSGGKTLKFVPFCAVHFQEDKVQEEKCVAAMRAFNAPFSVKLLEVDSGGMFDTAAEEMGKIFISTELGGGGSTTVRSVAIAKRGVKNLLHHAGVLAGDPEMEPSADLYMPDHRCFISSETTGLLELCVDLGDSVSEGQLLARVYDMERTGRNPVEYLSPLDGVFVARHFPGLVGMGDIVGVVAVEG